MNKLNLSTSYDMSDRVVNVNTEMRKKCVNAGIKPTENFLSQSKRPGF